LKLKVVLPTARAIPIHIHGGMKQYAWFDYRTDYDGEREDMICIASLKRTSNSSG